MKIRPGVHSFEVEWSADEPLGIHVIETNDASVLFGAGTEESGERVAGIGADYDVDVVIVEHGDRDHYGGVPTLREAVTDIEVAVPADDASFLEEVGIGVDHRLEAETTYWGITTISAPGHTPDNMAYLYENVLIAGDTVLGADSVFAVDGDWSGAFAVSGSNVDDEQARESVSNLLEYDFDTVLVSHGENVVEDGYSEIETLIADFG